MGSSVEAAAFHAVRRVCEAGLDSVELRRQVAARIRAAVGFDAYSLSTVDPETVLFTHTLAEGLPAGLQQAWVSHLYPLEAAVAIADQARAGEAVRIMKDGPTLDVMRSEGIGHEMRAVLTERESTWGNCCFLREVGARSFSEREAAFVRRVAPHVAQALRAAHLRERAGADEPVVVDPTESPGVLVLDGRGRVQMRNAAAAAQLEDLADDGMADGALPFAVASAAIQMRQRLARGDTSEPPPGSGVRARGRSGRWYTLRASLPEGDAGDRGSTIVVVDAATKGEAGAILARLYGLTPRECELVAAAARGESTKRTAHRLGLSPYTVQEHLGRACEKVGVRGRKALLARLFFDAYSPAARPSAGRH